MHSPRTALLLAFALAACLSVSAQQPSAPPTVQPSNQHSAQPAAPSSPAQTAPSPIPSPLPAPSTPQTPLPIDRQSVQVSAYRSPVSFLESPASTRVLTEKTLHQAAPVGLDGKLREVPGFDLFRRTSSLVANPTTEGVSLRGLGSTAASRTLVLLGDTPLNDPYGGWVHWEELPPLAIGRIEVVRGGVSDLYGSSAMGGVVVISPVQITPVSSAQDSSAENSVAPHPELLLESGYGAEALNDNNGRLIASHGPWSTLIASEVLATDGYILVAPSLRGPIDTRNNVHAQNALVFAERTFASPSAAAAPNALWLHGNVLNESRHNGTPLTSNATRLWRYSAGLDRSGSLGALQLRAWGSAEHYQQDFSSIALERATEHLTRHTQDPSNELGGAIRWQQTFTPFGQPDLVALAGGDLRDIRAEDNEQPTAAAAPATSTSARQTDGGGYGELLFTPGPWLFSGSARLDRFLNRDAATYLVSGPNAGARTPLPVIDQTVFDPRLGLSRRLGRLFGGRLGENMAASASAFRAYRAPTENELYRTGFVGQQTTLPNPNLRAERATGWETGLAGQLPGRYSATWRASYFWTEVNRPVTALTLSNTPTATTLQRANLGQIRSRGLSVDGSLHPSAWLSLTGGYQFARATVTQFSPQPTLIGKWIPQVPRNTGTLQATAASPRWGTLSLQARTSGRQYDDDENTYTLHSFTRLDVYASRTLHHRWELFTSVENLFDRSIDVGRTPIRTLGTPQLARFGIRLRLGGQGS